MTPCPNQCWCGYSKINTNNCECNCSFALYKTPHFILTWDQIGADLDLHVIDPNGEEISYLHQSSSSGGDFLRDRTSGPNAVELISWGLIQDGLRGPYGNYTINVVALNKYLIHLMVYLNYMLLLLLILRLLFFLFELNH